jgi:hypothetical protein
MRDKIIKLYYAGLPVFVIAYKVKRSIHYVEQCIKEN